PAGLLVSPGYNRKRRGFQLGSPRRFDKEKAEREGFEPSVHAARRVTGYRGEPGGVDSEPKRARASAPDRPWRSAAPCAALRQRDPLPSGASSSRPGWRGRSSSSLSSSRPSFQPAGRPRPSATSSAQR